MAEVPGEFFSATAKRCPDMLVLALALCRRNAEGFYDCCYKGQLIDRLGLTFALAFTCVLSVILTSLLAMDGLTISAARASSGGLAIVVVASLISIIAYFLLRHWTFSPSFFFFTNLILISATTTLFFSAVGAFLGTASSPLLQRDLTRMEAGQGKGTAIHEYYCGNVEARAALYQNGTYLIRHYELLSANAKEIEVKIEQRNKLDKVFQTAKAYALADYNDAVRWENLNIAAANRIAISKELKQALEIRKELVVSESRARDDGVSIENRMTFSSIKLAKAYVPATVFLIISVLANLLVWVWALFLIWKFIVPNQPNKFRRLASGATIVLLGIVTVFGLGYTRSGILEFHLRPSMSREALLEDIKYEFASAAGRCKSLNNYGLW